MARLLTIGQPAQGTGVSAKTIRYYEQVSVLPVPSRNGAGYRKYARGVGYCDSKSAGRLHILTSGSYPCAGEPPNH